MAFESDKFIAELIETAKKEGKFHLFRRLVDDYSNLKKRRQGAIYLKGVEGHLSDEQLLSINPDESVYYFDEPTIAKRNRKLSDTQEYKRAVKNLAKNIDKPKKSKPRKTDDEKLRDWTSGKIVAKNNSKKPKAGNSNIPDELAKLFE